MKYGDCFYLHEGWLWQASAGVPQTTGMIVSGFIMRIANL
jgi:hypothetical protein